MKSRLKSGLLLTVLIIAGSICFIVEKREQARFANLVLNNMEALASDEDNVSIFCYDDGALDCKGVRAKYIIDYQGLRYLK